MTRAKSYLSLLRPYQWAKNAFVFVGMAYAHLWADTRLLKLSIAAFVAFCLAASGSYVVNDLADRDRDRKHPLKKSRPIASGAVSAEQARLLAFLLWLAAFAISWWASPRVFFFVAGYAALNVLYSHQLKKVVIIDVFAISAGFMARILAGTLGIGIKPSHWLIVCGLMLTLFLGFAKRRAEHAALKRRGEEHREVLGLYSTAVLDQYIQISGTCAVMAYSLYTLSPDTVQIHHTQNLVYTVGFVVFAIYRYIYCLHHRAVGGDPTRDIFSDWQILASIAGWVATTLMIIR